MAEKDKKYFWLRLKRDFFKRHDIQIIEAMPNGKDYILFYLKLLCESVDHEGNLRFSDEIPYNETMLSTITNTNVDIVRSAIKIFSELGMMEILDDGTFYMNEVQKMMGSETYWAEKKRIYREKERQIEDITRTMSNEVGQCPTCPSKSKSIDKDIEIDKELDINNPPISPKGGKGTLDCKKMIQDTELSEPLKNTLCEWIDYKKEIKKPYKSERGFKQFINIVAGYTLDYSDSEIIAVINKSMASNYQGVVWDWLGKNQQQTKGSSYVDAINNRLSVVDEWLQGGE